MNSHTTGAFWRCFDALPGAVQDRARKAFALWQQDTAHPGVQFKNVHPIEPIYSVRITRGYRALGLRDGDTVTWFW
ncbi:MAG: ParE family toxin-like protein, partial [Alphaproteobacteria bacterium]